MKQWTYRTEVLAGDIDEAVEWINRHHPEWDIVTLHPAGTFRTRVVWREDQPLTATPATPVGGQP